MTQDCLVWVVLTASYSRICTAGKHSDLPTGRLESRECRSTSVLMTCKSGVLPVHFGWESESHKCDHLCRRGPCLSWDPLLTPLGLQRQQGRRCFGAREADSRDHGGAPAAGSSSGAIPHMSGPSCTRPRRAQSRQNAHQGIAAAGAEKRRFHEARPRNLASS